MSQVDLISITKPEGMDISHEEYIAYIARVSNPENQHNHETSGRLLKYLIEHKHWSPFEFVDVTFQIQTRRSIAAQILRHRSFSFQEFSQRYSNATRIESIELRKQAEKNRQSSTEVFDPVIKYGYHLTSASSIIQAHNNMSLDLYEELLMAGVAREVARDVLPLATETTLYMKGSVRSWIHYLQLRLAPDTQKEHREIAHQILTRFTSHFPIIGDMLLQENLDHIYNLEK